MNLCFRITSDLDDKVIVMKEWPVGAVPRIGETVTFRNEGSFDHLNDLDWVQLRVVGIEWRDIGREVMCDVNVLVEKCEYRRSV